MHSKKLCTYSVQLHLDKDEAKNWDELRTTFRYNARAMRIAIIGTGISALYVASHLAAKNGVHIDVFEKNNYIGGHTATVDVCVEDQKYLIDTGFIVFNDRTYPNFTKLLKQLEVDKQATDMSFGVRNDRTQLEYRASNLNSFFAQRKNILKPEIYQLIKEILQFRKTLNRIVDQPNVELSLGELLKQGNHSIHFMDNFVVPMTAAVWSAAPSQVLADFPALFFAQFFKNHGFLNVHDQPTWQVVKGGSKQYIPRLIDRFKKNIHLNSQIVSIKRSASGIELETKDNGTLNYDYLVLGTHSDQALALLHEPTPKEQEILGAFQYQPNQVVLHHDTSILPKQRRAWASWNYRIKKNSSDNATLTYWMNRLQGIQAPAEFLVTLNDIEDINPDKIFHTFNYSHPIYNRQTQEMQAMHTQLCGENRTYFCGAYWGYGFHEDGINSSINVLRAMQTRVFQS